MTILDPAALSEGEREGLNTLIEELDLECPISDWPSLPDELIQSRLLNASPSLGIRVEAMVGSRRRAIDLDAEADGVALGEGASTRLRSRAWKR